MLFLSGYKILEKINTQRNKVYYRAERGSDNQKVILKILENIHSSDEEAAMKHEFKLATDFSHKGISRYLSMENYNNKLVAVMEDFDGLTFDQYLTMHRCTIGEALHFADQIASILHYFYQKGMVHQDLCTANLLVNPLSLEIRLVDYSVASRVADLKHAVEHPGLLKASLAYISPEQTGRINGEIDIRSDLYSLGIIMYEMTTGCLPFISSEALSMIHFHIAKKPIPPQNLNPAIHLTVSKIILKLLSKNASDRYQSPFGLIADLQACILQWNNNKSIELNELGVQDFSGRLQSLKKYYGREKEKATLQEAFSRISSGPVDILFVEGYSGIGKSALVHQFKDTVLAGGGIFVESKFNQFQRNVPYFGFSQALNDFIDFILTQSNEKIASWRQTILTAVGVNGRLISDIIPRLESLLGVQPLVEELQPQETQNRFQYVFVNFIKAICQKDHPFVIFFDDLQWADAVSIHLLKIICMNKEIMHLLFIGAYRDNEIDLNSVFYDTIEKMQKEGHSFKKIILKPLSYNNVETIVLDILNGSISEERALIDLIYNKSQGNPFFIKVFLNAIHAERILLFNFNILQWTWDAAKISRLRLGDNIIELMTGRIQKLPDESQKILMLAACLGYHFNLKLLTVILNETSQNITNKLKYALDEDLIHINENDYCFIHDRMQQAAYSLLKDNEKMEAHIKIGKALLTNLEPETRNFYIFDIVNQLNAGSENIWQRKEKDQLAELNLTAGVKAKSAAAYNPSFEYLQTGIRLLDNDGWKNSYELALQLFTEGAESAFLNGNNDLMEEWIEVVLQNASTVLDKVKVYEIRIKFFIAQYKQTEAVQTALQILQLLNVRFPKKPTPLNVALVLLRVRLSLLGKFGESLKDLPLIKNPQAEAAQRILMSVGSAVIFVPYLFPLMVCKAFSLMLRYGNTAYSGIACSSYGMVILKGVGNIRSGYRWGDIAMQLSEKFEINSVKCQTRFLIFAFVMHWKQHLKDTLVPLLNNYWFGLENGNIEFATYSVMVYCQNAFFCGINLRKVTEDNKRFHGSFQSLRNKYAFNMHTVGSQGALNLFELVENPETLTGKLHDEAEMIDLYNKTGGKRELFKIYLYKLILSYLFDKLDEADRNAGYAENYIKSALGNPEIVIFYFFQTLSILSLIPRYSGVEKERMLRKAKQNIKIFKKFTEIAPVNCLHKLFLLQAELCRVTGRIDPAAKLYELAISKAAENDYINDQAVASELAGKFYLSLLRDEIARVYLVKSYNCYQQWAAYNKSRHMELKYFHIFGKQQVFEDIKSLPSNNEKENRANYNSLAEKSLEGLDLQTVMKAAAAISSEVQLELLLKKLVRIAVESAGAQQGYLILKKNAEFVIEAKGSIEEDADEVTLQSLPLPGNEFVSELIVQFVVATKENLVINNAIGHPHFSSDPVIREKRSKSILCTPIIHQGEVMGLLYFENNLIINAFTHSRIELLRLLSGQMAVSLQNALNEQKKTIAFMEREKLIKQVNMHGEELLKTKLEIQEQTFHNISGEIHDNIGQTLSFIKLNINTIDIRNPDSAKEKLLESRTLLTKVIQELRDLSKTFNADFIEEIGLDTAIDQQLQFLKKTGLYAALLSIKGDVDKYESRRELVLFRIVQEVLNNVVKHAEATAIHIQMDYQVDRLLITIQDNGKGFDVQKKQEQENIGLGLRNIHNRMSIIEGSVSFESDPENGTTVTIELPKLVS
jgi:histidine kinase